MADQDTEVQQTAREKRQVSSEILRDVLSLSWLVNTLSDFTCIFQNTFHEFHLRPLREVCHVSCFALQDGRNK